MTAKLLIVLLFTMIVPGGIIILISALIKSKRNKVQEQKPKQCKGIFFKESRVLSEHGPTFGYWVNIGTREYGVNNIKLARQLALDYEQKQE